MYDINLLVCDAILAQEYIVHNFFSVVASLPRRLVFLSCQWLLVFFSQAASAEKILVRRWGVEWSSTSTSSTSKARWL